MTARGHWFAHGSCLLCGRLFTFDPERVCSHPWPPPDGLAEPTCRPCITDRVNPERRRRGLPQFPILPGAYLDEPTPARERPAPGSIAAPEGGRT
jgi:hypothetical protein